MELPMLEKKVRSVNWTEREKLILVESVMCRENELYGRTKPNGSRDSVARQIAWESLTDKLNTELDIPRTAEQIKKAYENIKSRAKLQVDHHHQLKGSGRGFPASSSPAIDMIVKRLCGPIRFQPTSAISVFPDSNLRTPLATSTSPLSDLRVPRTLSTSPISGLADGDSCDLSHNNEGITSEEPSVNGDDETFLLPAPGPASLKRKRLEDDLLEHQVRRVRAEVEKLQAETKLIQSRQDQERVLFEARKAQEESIFELKKQLINAKIEHLKEIGDLT